MLAPFIFVVQLCMIYIFSFILSSFLFHFPTRSMNFFKNQKTTKTIKIIKMSFKDVMLKGFSLSNCTTKVKCWVVKPPRNSGHPSTKGRIRMNMGNAKRFHGIKTETIPLGGWFAKNLAQSLIQSLPRSIKKYKHTHNETHNTTKRSYSGCR